MAIKQPQNQHKNYTRKKTYSSDPIEAQSTISNDTSTIKPYVEYYNIVAQERCIYTEPMINLLIKDLLEWSDTPQATKLSKFFKSRGIDRKTVFDLCDKWPHLEKTWAFVKEKIGDYREDMGLQRKFDSQLVLRSMPLYDEEWLKESERVAKLTKPDNPIASSQAINVIMERFLPDDKLLEEKKDKDK